MKNILTQELTFSNKSSWVSTIWDVLELARDAVIPEGQAENDKVWNEVCTAMAWIEEELAE